MTPDDIQKRMADQLSPGLLKLIEVVAGEAQKLHLSVYIVGGFVRDLMLSRTNLDIDLVVEGDAFPLARALSSYGGKLQTYPQFGTATWAFDGRAIQTFGLQGYEWLTGLDFAMARVERYAYPGALPTVEMSNMNADLKRRDFSINAMAIEIATFNLLDPYSGVQDLEQGRLRVLHERSFIDDPTRILRGARYELRYGFKMTTGTEASIPAALPVIAQVSGERLRYDLDLILKEEAPENTLLRLGDLGVLTAIHPQLIADDFLAGAFRSLREVANGRAAWMRSEGPNFFWPILLYRVKDVQVVAERLQLDRYIVDSVTQLQRVMQAIEAIGNHPSASVFVRAVEPFESVYAQYAALAIASLRGLDAPVQAYIDRWSQTQPTLTGNDLIAMGLQQGPLLGKILRQLRDALLDGQIATPQDERQWVLEWLAKETPE